MRGRASNSYFLHACPSSFNKNRFNKTTFLFFEINYCIEISSQSQTSAVTSTCLRIVPTVSGDDNGSSGTNCTLIRNVGLIPGVCVTENILSFVALATYWVLTDVPGATR